MNVQIYEKTLNLKDLLDDGFKWVAYVIRSNWMKRQGLSLSSRQLSNVFR